MRKEKADSFFKKAMIIVVIALVSISCVRCFRFSGEKTVQSHEESVLALELTGLIIGKSQFLEDLRKHIKNEKIKGVLVRLDSPGGSVALSQEIYNEFKNIKETLKKPVVVSVGSMMASGGLYAASSASSILVQPGSLVGSIGVLVPMVNMERLYNWAKVEPYSIKTGEFKELGSNYRPMTDRERTLFQDLVDEMLEQFKKAITEGRKMPAEELELYADARIFSGDTAVSAGFADSIGTYSDAVKLIGKLTGLGDEVKLFKPKKSYFDLFSKSLSSQLKQKSLLSVFFSYQQMNARPLYVFPSAVGM